MLRVDVAEWLSHLLDQELEEKTIVQQLGVTPLFLCYPKSLFSIFGLCSFCVIAIYKLRECINFYAASGTVLCRLANHLEKKVKVIQSPTGVAINPTERAIRYYKEAIAGTPQAQENISRFNKWASDAGVPDNLIADERDFNTVVTGDSAENRVHDASNKIVAMLLNISSRQRVVAPPRSVDIGRRMDEGKLSPPAPEEVRKCKSDMVLFGSILGYWLQSYHYVESLHVVCESR